MSGPSKGITTTQAHEPPAPAGEAVSVLAMIEQAARDPAIDLDRMERLMTMHQDMKAEAAKAAYNAAMTAAQAEMPRILRDAANSHTQSRYARLETIHKAITPVVTRHGFSLSFDTEDCPKAGFVRLACIVAHEGGHERRHTADLPADAAGSQGKANKTAIQAFGSTVSYGRRYLTLLVFNVALTNEDNDGNAPSGPSLNDVQLGEVQDLVKEIGLADDDLNRFLGVMQAESLAEIPAAKFHDAVRRLRKFGRLDR